MSDKDKIKQLLIDNIDSGKLILVSDQARRPGKTAALIEVAKETCIPIYTSREGAYHLNRIAGQTVAYSDAITVMKKGKGFLTDDHGTLTLQKISELHRRMYSTHTPGLRVGFFYSLLLNADVALNDAFFEDEVTDPEPDPDTL